MSQETRLKAVFALAALLAGILAIPASAVNLISDPSFEGEGSLLDLGWESFAYTTTPKIDNTDPHTGDQHITITQGTVDAGSSGIYSWDHIGPPEWPSYNPRAGDTIIPYGSYTATVYAKTPNAPMYSNDPYGGANIRLFYRDEDNVTVGTAAIQGIGSSLTTTYQQFSVTATPPAEAVYIHMGLYAAKNSEAVYFDDVTLEFTPGPSSPVMQVNIDRDTGNVTLDATNIDIDLGGYTLTSANGSLAPGSWTSVTSNYDSVGDGSVDPNDPWTVVTNTSEELTEEEDAGGNGYGTITEAQTAIDLGNIWVKSPVEDLQLAFVWNDNGNTIPGLVNFTGGTGSAWDRSDLNFDGDIDADDWPTLRDNLMEDFSSSLTTPLAYQQGDLNGDLKVDFLDLHLFKADYNAANGMGAFEVMLAGVPEPTSLLLLATGMFGLTLTRRRTLYRGAAVLALLVLVVAVAPSATMAADVDFSNYTNDYGLLAAIYGDPDPTECHWPTYNTSTSSQAVLSFPSGDPNDPAPYDPNDSDDVPQASPHAFYGTTNVLNKRITGTINPGLDNDMFGLLLGYDAGEMTSTSADYILLDWMGPGSYMNFVDHPATYGQGQYFHDKTGGGTNQSGTAISRVSGTPTGDEFWRHIEHSLNPDGGVAELAEGNNWAHQRYPYEDILFDIEYTATRIKVSINGTPEFDVTGTFPDGKLALYSLAQSTELAPVVYKDFRIDGLDERLKATVNTATGKITLSSGSSDPIDLDAYSLESDLLSLVPGSWESLEYQSYTGWDESEDSDTSLLVEANYTGELTFGAAQSISLGYAYNTVIDAQDLVFTYAEPNGLISTGIVEYVSMPEDADFDGDSDIDGADFLIWQRGFGMTSQTDNSNGDANGDGTVNAADLVIWKAQFGTSAAPVAQAVPEPTSALLFAAAIFGFTLVRKRS